MDDSSTALANIQASAMALRGGGMMTTDEGEEEARALPLVGIGLLGLLPAGRGARRRRRTQLERPTACTATCNPTTSGFGRGAVS